MTIDDFIEEPLGERKIKYTLPTVRLRARMIQNARAWKKEQYADSLRLAGFDGEDMLPHLEKFDDERATSADLVKYLDGPDGRIEAQAKSLEKYHKSDAEKIIAETPDDRQQEIVARLWGMTLVPIELKPPADMVKVESEEPDPQLPLTYTVPPVEPPITMSAA